MPTVSGRVLSQSDGDGVGGLQVHFADATTDAARTPAAITGPDGAFRIEVPHGDESHGVLSVVAAPMQVLTRQVIATSQVDPHILSVGSAPRAVTSIAGRFHPPLAGLALQRVLGFVAPMLGDAPLLGCPGAPALPVQYQSVIVPPGKRIVGIDIQPGAKQVVPLGTDRPLPRQATQPDVPQQRLTGLPAREDHPLTPLDARLLRGASVYPAAQVQQGQLTRLGELTQVELRINAVRYDSAANAYEYTPDLAFTVQLGDDVAVRAVRPLTPSRAALLSNIAASDKLTMIGGYSFPIERAIHVRGPVVQHVIITDDVFWNAMQPSPRVVARPAVPGKPLELDAANHPPSFHFERLAYWKRARGLGSQVIRVSDIMAGKFGDMTNNKQALDLAEIVRNFIAFAHAHWRTEYVLIGGSIDVVPMRYLIGHVCAGGDLNGGWDCGEFPLPSPANPTTWPLRRCVTNITTGTARLRLDPAFGSKFPEPSTVLCRESDGLAIPHHAPGPSRAAASPNWQFVTATSFYAGSEPYDAIATPDDDATVARDVATGAKIDPAIYVVVHNLPNPTADSRFYCVAPSRAVPTDFYYGVLTTPAGGHGFDTTGNGVYGQYRWNAATQSEEPVDGFDLVPDVWVGRAPVRTAYEAASFVDKVIAYERMDPATSWTGYLERVLLIADRWQHEEETGQYAGADQAAAAPAPGTFSRPGGGGTIRIHFQDNGYGAALTKAQPKSFSTTADAATCPARLFARFRSPGERNQPVQPDAGAVWPDQDVLIPYAGVSGFGGVSWHFADENYAALPAGAACGTRQIVVDGLGSLPSPAWFFWDWAGIDSADAQKDALRLKMQAAFPGFGAVQRVYRDRYAYPAAASPTMTRLGARSAHRAIGDGPHFLSLTGHGAPSGCCWLDAQGDADFPKVNRGAITFVNSCSTSVPDMPIDPLTNHRPRSMGEWMVCMPGAGAVAYVGNTQIGFTGVEDAGYEEAFWTMLAACGRVGPAALYGQGTYGSYMWRRYVQNLYGDPEMPVWLAPPGHYVVIGSDTAARGGKFEVFVTDAEAPLAQQSVTLLAGDVGGTASPEFWQTIRTDPQGRALFSIPPALKASEISLVVSAGPEERASRVPYVGVVKVA